MVRNQLPEGVGKKIVEALKRQNEADITFVDENKKITNSVPLTNIEDLPEIKESPILNIQDNSDNDFIIEEEETPNVLLEGAYKEKEETPQIQEPVQKTVPMPSSIQNSQVSTPAFSFKETAKQEQPAANYNTTINIPANVLVLKNLIATLPVGVTKQTGAQIIRQTLEAMGLPMNSVLKEAQSIQEELNSSTRECMLKIQEYKTQILQLEQSVQDYQKNITQINDLVSLFLLTDKN